MWYKCCKKYHYEILQQPEYTNENKTNPTKPNKRQQNKTIKKKTKQKKRKQNKRKKEIQGKKKKINEQDNIKIYDDTKLIQ